MKYIASSVIIGLALFGPISLFALGAGLYILRYSGYWLLAVAIAIDLTFMVPDSTWPWRYTLLVGSLLLMSAALKPFLRYYRET
jgi:hypothetical protein